ncbi:hypothetical protein LXL04_037420 [Taraxacum kok-saghyz]
MTLLLFSNKHDHKETSSPLFSSSDLQACLKWRMNCLRPPYVQPLWDTDLCSTPLSTGVARISQKRMFGVSQVTMTFNAFSRLSSTRADTVYPPSSRGGDYGSGAFVNIFAVRIQSLPNVCILLSGVERGVKRNLMALIKISGALSERRRNCPYMLIRDNWLIFW